MEGEIGSKPTYYYFVSVALAPLYAIACFIKLIKRRRSSSSAIAFLNSRSFSEGYSEGGVRYVLYCAPHCGAGSNLNKKTKAAPEEAASDYATRAFSNFQIPTFSNYFPTTTFPLCVLPLIINWYIYTPGT